MVRVGLGLALGLVTAAASDTAAWPEFRGPHRSGVASPGSSFPIHFGPGTNEIWRIPVPSGHSSPVIQGGQLFLTGYETNRLLVLAYDRSTGASRWRQVLEPGTIEQGSRLSHPATATPSVDNERVVSYFAPFGLIAHTHDGRELWRHPLPTPLTQHGASSSPVLAANRVFQLCDQDAGSFLLALDARTAAVAWRIERPGFRRGFSTPLPWPPNRPEMLIVAGTLRLVAYDLATGAERWSVNGLPNEMVSSPVGAADGTVYVAGWTSGSGVPRMPPWDTVLAGDRDADGQVSREEAPNGPARHHFPYIDADRDGRISRQEYEAIAGIFDHSQNVALAIRPDGRGDVTGSHVIWRQTRGLPYVPSPLVHDGRLHLVRNGGISSCLDARTGAYLWQEERLGALGDNYASPIAAGPHILVVSQPGTAVVLRSGPTLEVLARNPLGEEVLATPAIAGNTLYVRTRSSLAAYRNAQATVADPPTQDHIPTP